MAKADMANEEEMQDRSAEEEGTEQPASDNSVEQAQELMQELSKERERADANMAGWQRAVADFANYRKEVERQRGETVRNANGDLIRRLLPIIDDMERAFQNVPLEIGDHSWVKGMRQIQQKAFSVFEQEGVTAYDSLGQEFDPAYHDAITVEETSPDNDGKVVGEILRGYRFRDRVLRPAMVKVGRARQE
jgi:molecular chaperone GrpE